MKYKTKILIVEDEAIIAESIKMTLESLGYNVVGITDNALDTIELFQNNKVDLAIVDIHIQGKKNGIWLAKNVFQNIPFIYLTAFGDDKTVQEAVKTKPSAYLLKPFKKINIATAIELAIINYTKNQTAQYSSLPSTPINNTNLLRKKETIFIKQKEAYIKLDFNDILFFEADKNYLKIQTKNSEFTIRNTIKNISESLPENFLQIHRSFIINVNYISKIMPTNIKMQSYVIPLGNSYKKKLLSIINTLN